MKLPNGQELLVGVYRRRKVHSEAEECRCKEPDPVDDLERSWVNIAYR